MKVDTANTTMKTIDLDADVQGEVRDYFHFTRATLSQQEELNKFIALISPSIKLKIQRHVFLSKLQNNEVLNMVSEQLKIYDLNSSLKNKRKSDDNDEFIHIVVNKLETQTSIPEDLIIKQDEESFNMYFISKGKCTVQSKDEVQRVHKNIRELNEGDHFGEIAVIYSDS